MMIVLKQLPATCLNQPVLVNRTCRVPLKISLRVLAGSRGWVRSTNLFSEKTLTENFLKDILSLSLPNEVVRSLSLSYGSDTALNPGTKNQGVGDYTTCISLFLCPKSLLSALKNLPFWWSGLSEQLLDAAVQTDFLLHRPKIEPLRGGLQLNQGVAIMRNHAQEPTKSNKLTTYVSLIAKFTLLDSNKHTIAEDLTFTQVKPLSEHIPNSIIKFKAMVQAEGSL